MDEASFIEKRTLPLALNYELLQEQGLAYIQEHSSKAWTNLNPSDPGITILEQLCFAFTELGYCNNFPIKDILTNREEVLQMKNQFYTPENILTITPITLQDYIKYVIDRVDGVKNTQVKALKAKLDQVKGAYQFDLLLGDISLIEEVNDEITMEENQNVHDPISLAAFFELNYARNLGEYFFMPNRLKKKSYQLNGTVEIDAGYDLIEVLKNIQYTVNNYIFPDVTQTGYDTLRAKGLSTNDIFNGPILKNGWIPDDSMSSKKKVLQNFEVIQEIGLVPGVISVNNVTFYKEEGQKKQKIASKTDQILYLDVIDSYNNGSFKIIRDGVQETKNVKPEQIQDLIKMEQLQNQTEAVSAIKMAPDLPKGKYRDIEDYYSIQNTFPQSYGLGLTAANSGETPFQIAQTRQLRGYLTLYDQSLINQFAQLANLDKLFSFKNSITGTPFDRSEFYNSQTKIEKAHPKFVAPFECFSPTYYYQSLYKVLPDNEVSPDIEKLLKNYDAYRYNLGLNTPQELDNIGWEAYKESPYNSYIWGLMYYMEDQDINLERRNEMLDHLLARHGQSPVVINTIVNNPVYSGNLEMDRVIIKSIYLQNFQTLSYNKSKAYNYLAADILLDTLDIVDQMLLNKLEEINGLTVTDPVDKNEITPELEAQSNLMLNSFTHASQHNFIFDVNRVDKREEVTALDVINFAAIHLKLTLLFGLNEYYQNYIVGYPEMDTKCTLPVTTVMQNLLWMMTQQKGLFFIETNLLINSADFKLVKGKSYDIVEPENPENFTYEELIEAFQIKEHQETVKKDITAVWGIEKEKSLNNSLLEHTFILVFPNFLNTYEFVARLEFFLQSELAPELSYTYLFVDCEQLHSLIPIYCDWHNSLIYQNKDSKYLKSLVPKDPKMYAWRLVHELEIIKKNPPKQPNE